MFDFVKKLFGTKQDKDIKKYMPLVDQINTKYDALRHISNDELRAHSELFREQIRSYTSSLDQEIQSLRDEASASDDMHAKELIYKDIDKLIGEKDKAIEEVLWTILPEAFAVVKETSRRFSEDKELRVTATEHDRNLAAARKGYVRIEGDTAIWQNEWLAAGGQVTWNMVHYDVQLIGGMALHDGNIAEMATGEGKTLVATLPAYLNGLTGLGVHVITVNDYLARRDCEWVGPIYEFLLLTVDCIDRHEPHSPGRIRAYQCDITFGTNNEFGFDYLRDNMVRSSEEVVQKKHHYAIVDEVDSVLIDDARTPLIISGPVPQGVEDAEYLELNPKVQRLVDAQAKLANEFLAQAKKLWSEGKFGSEEGQAGLALLRAHRALPKHRALIKFLSEDGVRVELQKAENNYMQEQNKRMPLADKPLLFTIDEKNRQVELTEHGAEFLSKGMDDHQAFIIPDISTELVALESNAALSTQERAAKKEELIRDFSIKSTRMHAIHQLLKAYTLFEIDQEYVVMNGEIKIVDEQTGRMMEGRRYSDGLHQALEAKENVKVGELTQTYATITLQNYFRMYHKLCGMTGTAETEAGELWQIYKLDVVVIPTNRNIVRKDMEDMVYKTSREKFNAVIDDIVAITDAKRPVLVGTTSVDISEKLSRMLQMRGIKHNVLNAKQHQREAEIVTEAGRAGAVTIATNMAGRGTDIKLDPIAKSSGGLAIIGTERHESRRVDRQLRGRSGRQGDPGSTQFYVSLEDPLMRLFQSERIAKMMDRMGHKDGEVIQHSMVTASIERAQKKVEENNFGIRKRLLEYDDVMNIQRDAIYKKRKNALYGERLNLDIFNMINSLSENLVTSYKGKSDYDSFRIEVYKILEMDPEMDPAFYESASMDAVVDDFTQKVQTHYHEKCRVLKEELLPIIQNVHANEGHKYKRIALPFTIDRQHILPLAADLENAIRTNGNSIITDIEKAVTLMLIDEEWKEHLRTMDELKESVQAASFEQKDPLVIYKLEAFHLFEELIGRINEKVTAFLLKGDVLFQDGRTLKEAREQKSDPRLQMSRRESTSSGGQRPQASSGGGESAPSRPQTIIRNDPKVGRNDPCPCGSGKKYKSCHGS